MKLVETKDFNALINNKPFFDQPAKNKQEAHGNRVEISRNDDYTTENLFNIKNIINSFALIYQDKQIQAFFFSVHTYTHVQFEQLHKYIQKRNKIYKKWYRQKQSLDIKLFGISMKQTKKKNKQKQKGDVSS